ncbi:MAG TPA: hypothetical protein VHX61_06215 [Rhizomicrobium sp.]|jgi:hypothetical protein|nr:hypothetical protein [Rhizomicrobium sp.]
MPETTQDSRSGRYDQNVRERPGWLVPIAVLTITAVLGAVMLVYYLAPNPVSLIEEHSSPSAEAGLVHLTIGGLSMTVPANYLPYASERRGGARREVTLYASLPNFQGYSKASAAEFAGNGPASALIYLLIREGREDVPESALLRRIYLGDVIDPRGRPGPFGLTAYRFRDDSGYRGEDMFVGRIAGRDVVMRCLRPGKEAISPTCFRNLRLAQGVVLSYRFKLSHLSEWREIARGAGRLIASFTTQR